ncbi:hypothetical protein M9H77_34114 [Catharanthus roseus]|uniref:Uncharacterized protein n=1 Tax=Catharanthus roseus TaxID=4058 RepID=A0ACB9ZKD1_CATRO|nr:hypothetical protein M9H77_34114 [Catharanthus roseus]
MDAIHPVKVLLFWDSEIARDAYRPYFTGIVQKGWTLPMNQMISHAELVRKILKYRDGSKSLERSNDDEGAFILRKPSYEGIYILVEFVQIQQQTISSTQAINTTNMTEHITKITQMVSHEPSMLYATTKIMSHLVNLNQMITMTRMKKSYKLH